MKIYKIILLLITIAPRINAQELLTFSSVEAASVGIYIEDLKSGKVIASQNKYKALTPASVTKSITSAAAMLLLNNNFQFETRVFAVGDTIINNGILNCDIVIDACGDPTIESKHFPDNKGFITQIIKELYSKGVNTINGDIKINTYSITQDNITSSWMLEDVVWDYGAELKAFNYKDNSFELSIRSIAPEILITHNIPNLNIDNRLTIGEENDISLMRPPMSNNLVLAGTISATTSNYKIGCSVPNPTNMFISDLKSGLSSLGISINYTGKKDVVDTMIIYRHKSPKRDEILKSLMVRSDNLFADAMMQAISPQGGAIDSVISKFKSINLDCRHISLYDGCGLSRIDRLTPCFIASVYRYMYNSDMCTDYVALFPRAGFDGTLKHFLAGTRLKGKLALKTGSMGGVQCYGGYKLNERGIPTHIVVIMVNNFFCKRNEVRKDIERLLLQIF